MSFFIICWDLYCFCVERFVCVICSSGPPYISNNFSSRLYELDLAQKKCDRTCEKLAIFKSKRKWFNLTLLTSDSCISWTSTKSLCNICALKCISKFKSTHYYKCFPIILDLRLVANCCSDIQIQIGVGGGGWGLETLHRKSQTTILQQNNSLWTPHILPWRPALMQTNRNCNFHWA